MTTQDLPLGRAVEYPRYYDPGLLFPLARNVGRAALAVAPDAPLPFVGIDRWNAYELSWLDPRGKPIAEVATFSVPADSPCLIESKSLKLFLNSFNASRFERPEDVRMRIAVDLSHAAGAPVDVRFGLPAMEAGNDGAIDLDAQQITIDDYGPPKPIHLIADGAVVEQSLRSALLKSNCPVTGQPDWAEVRIDYRGPRIDPAGLLRYLVSFRDHAEFHEQCVERIFIDMLTRCRAERLSVEARYTRRGGLDINPWRGTPGLPVPPAVRALRQ
jgi:7-cyano-7-deazaguanine reductase